MKNLFLIIITFALCVSLVGCGAEGKPAANAVANTASTMAGPEKPEGVPDKHTTTRSSEVTGVAVCDEYLTKLDAFIENPKVPQTVRDSYRQSLEQNRTAWKQAASTPQGKAGLETSCKMALDTIRPTLEQFDK